MNLTENACVSHQNQPTSRIAVARLLPGLMLACLALAWAVPASAALSSDNVEAASPEQLEFFERKVRPILAERCFECHSGDASRLEGGLRLDHKDFYIQGGDSGPALDTNEPSSSLFLQAIRFENYEMPPSGKLPENELAILTRWIEEGAYWPNEEIPNSDKSNDTFDIERRKQEHWAWKATKRDQTPPIEQLKSAPSGIDAWIQSRLAQSDLAPATTAGRDVLIRRVYWDLLGLPPTLEQLHQWKDLADDDWYSQLLDSILADPQFGVRFGRHWLDSVRYAQSRGHEFDEDIPAAEQYRDYIVRALNADVPYDQFLREHLAGDLIKAPRRNPVTRWNESILGTGFWHMGEWVHSPVDVRKDETDRFDNMVDVFSKTFLGLTVACARCHDHKFDAISTADYYAMFGFLRSSHYTLYRFETDEAENQISDELNKVRTKYRTKLQSAFEAIVKDKNPEEWDESPIPPDETHPVPSVYPIDAPELLVDFSNLSQTQFRANGFGFGKSPLGGAWAGATLNTSANAAGILSSVNWVSVPRIGTDTVWNQINSQVTRTNASNRYSQTDQAGKTFISPWFELTTPKVHFLVRGNVRIFTAIDSYRLMSGPLHGEVLLESRSEQPEQWRWVTSHDLSRYHGKRIHIEFSPLDSAGCEVLQIASSVPANQPPPASSQIGAMLHNLTSTTAPRKSALTQSNAIEAVIRWLVQSPEAISFSPQVEPLRQVIRDWQRAEQDLAEALPRGSRIALGMIDGVGQNDYLLIRGNSDRPGEEIGRRNLEAFGSNANATAATPGSGRMELAESLLAEENPLVARVMANRIWHHLMGRGIVATTDDFGVQGRLPSHPELLDELAQRLRDSDWSIKALVREICSSHVYSQQTATGPYSTNDPNNELLAFANTKKLQGEVVRDGLFSVAGQINRRIDGGTAKVYLSDFLTGRGRPGESGPLHGDGRRSIYLEVRRNFLNPMLTAFDMPTPFSSMGRRNVSNVPAQALTMLNDPLIHWLAEQWATELNKRNDAPEKIVQDMFEMARGRVPSETELRSAIEFLELKDDQRPTVEAWKDLAHVLLNSKELQFNF